MRYPGFKEAPCEFMPANDHHKSIHGQMSNLMETTLDDILLSHGDRHSPCSKSWTACSKGTRGENLPSHPRLPMANARGLSASGEDIRQLVVVSRRSKVHSRKGPGGSDAQSGHDSNFQKGWTYVSPATNDTYPTESDIKSGI
jgi:hypothetical protein